MVPREELSGGRGERGDGDEGVPCHDEHGVSMELVNHYINKLI